VLGLLRVPSLWPTAVRQAVRLLPRRPSRAYYLFRMETQYGDATHRPEADDLLTYLRWCREWNRAALGKR
jgi:hypothetical protein